MKSISNFIIPIMVLYIIIYGLIKKVNVYDSFIEGAKESISMIVTIFPYLLGMMFSINIFLHSNILNLISFIFTPLLNIFKIPIDIIPMILLRSISGTSSLSVMTNIFSTYGPDSFIGRLASTIQGCTDTTFYVLTLYFGSIGIKKIRYSLFTCLFADFIGIVSSIIIVKLLF